MLSEDRHHGSEFSRQEEVVHEIDVKCSATYILEGNAHELVFREEGLVRPKEGKQYRQSCEGQNQSYQETAYKSMSVSGKNVAIDVQHEICHDATHQQPATVEPLLYLLEMLVNEAANDEEQKVLPTGYAEQSFYRFGYGNGIGYRQMVYGQKGYACQ